MAHFRTLSVSLGLAAMPFAQCCMGVGSQVVTFNGQKNIVIWDPKTKMEHFIRDAKFDSTLPDLGFIAPTPTEPDLGEAKDNAFVLLNSLDPRPKGGRGATAGFGGGGGGFGGGASEVTVVAEKDVAGFHATVLKATDSGALTTWLKVNGYKVNDSEQDWLDFYVKKQWFFTAFKVLKADQPDKDDKSAPIRTGSLRISFIADEPYNPYFVPVDNVPKQYRSTDQLSVLFVAPGRYNVQIGHEATWDSTKQWQAPLPSKMRSQLAHDIGVELDQIPENSTVTSYLDTKFPRESWDDLFFQKIIEKPVNSPKRIGGRDGRIGFILLAALPLGLLLRRRR